MGRWIKYKYLGYLKRTFLLHHRARHAFFMSRKFEVEHNRSKSSFLNWDFVSFEKQKRNPKINTPARTEMYPQMTGKELWTIVLVIRMFSAHSWMLTMAQIMSPCPICGSSRKWGLSLIETNRGCSKKHDLVRAGLQKYTILPHFLNGSAPQETLI